MSIKLTPICIAEARRLEVRCGLKAKDQTRKVYVHMLNGTLCATERALCCLVENYQTPDVRLLILLRRQATDRNGIDLQGLVIPEVLRPYMQGRDFLPWVKELPKGLQRKQA
jgi:seryl-tRNA synthetase